MLGDEWQFGLPAPGVYGEESTWIGLEGSLPRIPIDETSAVKSASAESSQGEIIGINTTQDLRSLDISRLEGAEA